MFNFKGFNAKKMFAKNIGIDLGTSSVIVYVEGAGIPIISLK